MRQSVPGVFGCGAMLGTGPLQVTISGHFGPGSCSNRGDPLEQFCMFHLPISQQTFDFGGCRDPGHLAQCNKPLTEAQVQVIQEALEATARPQLPSHLDLLAVQLKQPPPYPQMPQAEILVWV